MNLDSVRADFDPKAERVATVLDVRLNEKLKLKTLHKTSDGVVSTDLIGKRWKVGYDFVKKTIYGQFEQKYEGFDIRVRQSVPDLNWSVVPSPEIQLETKLIKEKDVSDRLELKYDMNKRLASVEERLKFQDKHELIVATDSVSGVSGSQVTVKTKVNKPYVKTVSAKYSHNQGPIFGYSVDPTDRLGVTVEAALNPKTIKGEFVYKPEQAENAEVGIKFIRPINSTATPSTGLFVKWNFAK